MGKVIVNGQEFTSLKEAQDYAAELKKDPNYVPPVKTDVQVGVDLAATGADHTVTTTAHSEAVQSDSAASDVLPDNYEDMTDKQKEDYDLDMQQAVYESSTPEEQAQIDAANDAFDKEHKINDYAEETKAE